MMGHRITRYGVTGICSLLTHLLVLVVLVEGLDWASVPASTLGFIASIGVSFALQHAWVFDHDHPVSRTLPRFLVVTAVGLSLNALIMAIGTGALNAPYLFAQAVAFIAIPVSNYLLNRRWTFDTSRALLDFEPAWPAADTPPVHRVLLIVLMIAFVSAIGASVLHLDLARDLAIAFDMRQSGDWVLLGPQLAGVFNLGPIWYYLLAGLQGLGLSITGIAFVLLVLASLAFPLVHRAGSLWRSPTAGMVWAMLLLLPGWPRFEQIFITHPVLTTVLLAATLVFGLQFVKRGRLRDLILMSLGFSLALHAHPTSLMVIGLPLGLLILGSIRHGPRPIQLLLAGMVALLPFLPYLLDQSLTGWPLLQGLGEFQSGQGGVWSSRHTLTVAWQLLGGGVFYCLHQIIGLPAPISAALTAAVALLSLTGLAGSIWLAMRGDRIALIFWITLISGGLGLVGLRVVHPYYMLTPLWFILTGLIAIGLSHGSDQWRSAGPERHRRKIALVVTRVAAVLVIASHLTLIGSAARHLQAGQWPFAFYPFMDIKQAAEQHRPHAFMTALQSRQSGRWLCRQEPLALHGPLALTLIHGYAMDARLSCDEVTHWVGGHEGDRPAVVGLSRAMASVVSDRPVAEVGAFQIFNVKNHPRRQQPIDLERFRDYPPYTPAFNPESQEKLTLDSQAGRWLIVTHLGFALSRRPEVTVHCDDQPVEPLGEDNTTWLFDSRSCPGELVLTLRVSHPDHVDIVQF